MVTLNIKVVKVIDSGVPNGLRWLILHLKGKENTKILSRLIVPLKFHMKVNIKIAVE